MRVLLDATAIPVDRGGVGRYLDSLVPELAQLASTTPEFEFTVAAQDHDVAGFRAAGADVVPVTGITDRGRRMCWEQAQLPELIAARGISVLHSPHYTMPVATSAPVVVTLHDATFFSDPGLHTPVKRHFFRAATRFALRRAAGLIVPSAATRGELARLVSPQARRASVIPHGVDSTTFRPPLASEVSGLRQQLQLADAPFVAFLGTIEPRKNVPNLIRGWLQACRIVEQAGHQAPALVLAGSTGWDQLTDRVAGAVPVDLRLIRTGYLPLPRLRALLGGARVVAYPALGEGFGLPVLEAMACGGCVLTTGRLSLPEVGGDAVAYTEVDPYSIGQALAGLLTDPARQRRLGAAGLARAASFSWRHSAKLHWQVYQRVAAKHGGGQ